MERSFKKGDQGPIFYQINDNRIIIRGDSYRIKDKLKEKGFNWNGHYWSVARGSPEHCKVIEQWLQSAEINAISDPQTGSSNDLYIPASAPQLGVNKNFDLPINIADINRIKRRHIKASTVEISYINNIGVEDRKVTIRVLKVDRDKNELLLKMERGNVTLRKYSDHIQRFLKVEFNDKDPKRTEDLIMNGFILNEHEYEFLGYSNSNLRECKCWFWRLDYSAAQLCTALDLISELGSFGEITDVGKCGARLGQCFSSTLPTIPVSRHEIEVIPDYTNDQYCFSDGCGRISADMATRIAKSLNLIDEAQIDSAKSCLALVESGLVPSAFQVRLGGVKGVLAVHPCLPFLKKKDDGNSHVIHIQVRPSMVKFKTAADNLTLDICTWPIAKSGRLNRQFIPLLIDMGIEKNILRHYFMEVLLEIRKLTVDRSVAIKKLARNPRKYDFLLESLIAGHDLRDPYLFKKLHQLRTSKLIALRDKTSIPIRESCNVIGLVDETGVLEPGQCFFQRKRGLDTIPHAHYGPVLVAKNPSYYKGDLRVLTAVDVPQLRHIVNCIVFPNHGSRPHPDEIAGSDLDGDQYFVCWDTYLIPKAPVDPLVYAVNLPKNNITDIVVDHPIQLSTDQYEAIKRHYLNSMADYAVGTISTYHSIWTDLNGSDDKKCIELARLFSQAIDAPKHGVDSELDNQVKSLKPDLTKKPDWMGGSRISTSILGELYRLAKEAYDEISKETPDPAFIDEDLLPPNHGSILQWRELVIANKNLTMFTETLMDKEVFEVLEAIDFAAKECRDYGKKMSNALNYPGQPNKKNQMWDAAAQEFVDPRDVLVAQIKQLFLKRFEENFQVPGDALMTREKRLLGASAYYLYIYKIHRSTYTFAWIPLQYLSELKYSRCQYDQTYYHMPKAVLDALIS